MQNQQTEAQALPLVTFVIAYYQLPVAMLCECIDSILALSLNGSEREIIVVDDGSANSPLAALDKYLGEIVYIRQNHQGLSQARNRGIQAATGRYLQFVDGDDYLLRLPYEHCLELVRNGKPDVVMFDFTSSTDGDAAATYNTDDLHSGTEYLSHHNLQATACCYLFRRAILGELRFTPGIYHEDEEFTPQLLLRADSVRSTDAQAYYYRQRPQSITTDTDIRKTLQRLADMQGVIGKLDRMADTLPTADRAALQRRVAQLTMDYVYNIIVQTRSRRYLNRKLEELRRQGLFPLPDRDYTQKYKWFRRLTNSSAGLSLLMNVLPLMKRER